MVKMVLMTLLMEVAMITLVMKLAAVKVKRILMVATEILKKILQAQILLKAAMMIRVTTEKMMTPKLMTMSLLKAKESILLMRTVI